MFGITKCILKLYLLNSKMKMKVQVISRESIKPSSPTPPHLKTFNLCFLDQIAPPFYIPIFLFYANNSPNDIENAGLHCRLKRSLSETLTSFYPLAGRINGNTSVECNDEGANYVEARVSGLLSEVIVQPNVADVLKMFLPCNEPHFDEADPAHGPKFGSKILLAIQVNVFDCGGIMICVCLSHKISDAYSMSKFINCWAAKTHNCKEEVLPISELSSIFPQRDLLGYIPSAFIHRGKGKIVTKRFVFDASKIASLRASGANSSHVSYPTRIEALSALIWRRFMESTRAKNGLLKEYVAIHAVNFRRRMDPPLKVEGLENTLGNIFGSTFTASQDLDSKKEPHILVSKLRDAISKIDGKYLRRILCGNAYLESFLGGLAGVAKGETGLAIFSSWCRFPWYETDFGWGKPTWVSISGFPCRDLIILMDTRTGDGIEAWVNMLDEDMAEFEQDEKLLEYVSTTPSA